MANNKYNVTFVILYINPGPSLDVIICCIDVGMQAFKAGAG